MLWLVILFLAGVALIIAEFFVPGLVCGIVGGLCLLGGAAYGVYQFPDQAFFIIFAYALGAFTAVTGGVMILPRTAAGRRMILQPSITDDADWVSDVSDDSLIGEEGVVNTTLRPSGTIVLGDKRHYAVSNGEYIEKDERVRVIEVHGNRVVVERIDIGAIE
jgi:membrane-bound serine protease (ClpP class)